MYAGVVIVNAELLTAGEFARLARTTKRTVLWYDEKGILEPHRIDDNGYRFYRPGQIIDFQTILLLRRLGFSIKEVKQYLSRGKSLAALFRLKRSAIQQEIAVLERMLTATNHFYKNLAATSTLVKPQIKAVKAFDIFYLEKSGPYTKIKDYCQELKSLLVGVPQNAVYLTIFIDPRYSPRQAQMRIGVVATPGMRPRSAAVQRMRIPAYRALCYIHHGSGTLLSLLWKELERYQRQHKLGYNPAQSFASRRIPHLDPNPFSPRGAEEGVHYDTPTEHRRGKTGLGQEASQVTAWPAVGGLVRDVWSLELYKHTSLNGETNEDLMEFELRLPIA